MPLLAAAATTLEKIQAVPPRFWLNVLMGVGILAAALFLIRKAAEMNKIVLSVIIFVALSIVGLNWIYHRNEPAFLTPYVDSVAPFFPSAQKQAQKERKLGMP